MNTPGRPATTDPTLLCAGELEALYRARRLSPVELVQATLARIERLNPVLNAYRVVDATAALADARASEKRWHDGAPLGPIDGVTFGVKDLLLARGHETRYGSRAATPFPDTSVDAPSVARLREAGAIFLGKTTTSEFGWKGTADNTLTGITRNPWDTSRTSGGSSGGAAAAAASGLGVFQLGTDGGGSVRIPAAFTGLFGMKASFGRVPAWPAGPMMTLSHVGPITRTVDDGARMLAAITRPDARDWYALPAAQLDFDRRLPADFRGLRIGYYAGSARMMVDPEVAHALRSVADAIANSGATVEEVELPIDNIHDMFMSHWYAGAQHLVAQVPADRRELIDPGLMDAAQRGSAMSIETYYRATFMRQRLGETLQEATRAFDAIITPTLPFAAFEAGREWPAERQYASWTEWACFLYPFNLSRQPAASVPVGLTRAGLPIGAQVVGALYDDERVVAISRALEQMMPRLTPPLAAR